MLDSIAVHWLLAIDKRLIGIVKTEFAADLKTKRLCQMIKQIAPNVDDLLTRYGHQDSINSVAATCTPSAVNLPKSTPPSEDTTIDMIINRIERLEKTQQPRRSQTNRFKSRNKFTENCVHCSFLNKQLGTTFNTKHDGETCTRKKVSISVINSLDENADMGVISQDSDTYEGEKNISPDKNSTDILQSFKMEEKDQIRVQNNSDCCANVVHPINVKSTQLTANDFSELKQDKNIQKWSDVSPSKDSSIHGHSGTKTNSSPDEISSFLASVHRLSSSNYSWNSILKSKSPRMKCTLKNTPVTTLVDSGAEVNVMDGNVGDTNYRYRLIGIFRKIGIGIGMLSNHENRYRYR